MGCPESDWWYGLDSPGASSSHTCLHLPGMSQAAKEGRTQAEHVNVALLKGA